MVFILNTVSVTKYTSGHQSMIKLQSLYTIQSYRHVFKNINGFHSFDVIFLVFANKSASQSVPSILQCLAKICNAQKKLCLGFIKNCAILSHFGMSDI